MIVGHSYQGQDRFVIELLGGLRGGFFLDSGASNGVNGSNSLLLEAEFGWTGICIEPNAAMFQALVHNRRCICVHCCLYDRDGSVEFLEAAGVYGGIIAEYDPSHLEFARSVVEERWPGGDAPAPIARQARTVRSVLREAGAPSVIDYWSLDTEGSELAILHSFPFDEYRVRALTVEHNGGPARADIRRLLESRGYVLAGELGIDDAYVWHGDAPARAWRSGAWSRARRSAR